MCGCVREWLTDEEVEGSHNRVPLTCDEVIVALEGEVETLKRKVLELTRAIPTDRGSVIIMCSGVTERNSAPVLNKGGIS